MRDWTYLVNFPDGTQGVHLVQGPAPFQGRIIEILAPTASGESGESAAASTDITPRPNYGSSHTSPPPPPNLEAGRRETSAIEPIETTPE